MPVTHLFQPWTFVIQFMTVLKSFTGALWHHTRLHAANVAQGCLDDSCYTQYSNLMDLRG